MTSAFVKCHKLSVGPKRTVLRLAILALLLLSPFALFAENLALNAPCFLDPSPKYAHTMSDSDKTKLTDGKYSDRHFWTDRQKTAGWVNSGPITIEIDLLNRSRIDTICINSARGNKAGVSFPERVDVFFSNDKTHYGYGGNLMDGKDHNDGHYLVKKFCSDFQSVSARYVHFAVKPKGSFVFLDEIEVQGGSKESQRTEVRFDVNLNRKSISSFILALAESELRKRFLSTHVKNMQRTVNERSGNDQAVFKIKEYLATFGVHLEKQSHIDERLFHRLRNDLYAINRRFLDKDLQEPLLIWQKDLWINFSPFDLPDKGKIIKRLNEINMMRRGSSSTAFILTNNRENVQKVLIQIVPGTVSPDSPSVTAREVSVVVSADGVMRGDPLTSIAKNTITLHPGESKEIWLSVCGRSADPGNYDFRVTLSDPASKKGPAFLPLRVKVWPAAFPNPQNVKVNNWAYLNWRPVERIPDIAVRDLYEHHVNVFVVHPIQLPWPALTMPGKALTRPKEDELGRVAKAFKKNGTLLLYLGFNDKEWRSRISSQPFLGREWKAAFGRWIKDTVQHLSKQGYSYDRFAVYPVDEPKNRDEIDCLLNCAALIKGVDAKIRVYTTLGTLSGKDLANAVKVVDIFQVLVSELSSENVTALINSKKEVWSYTAEGGGKKANPFHFYRLQAWKAFRSNAKGIGFWAYADTGRAGTAWSDVDGKRPDYSVVYEAKNGIVSSKRWEAWKEGVEDFELLLQAKAKLRDKKETDDFEKKLRLVARGNVGIREFEDLRRGFLEIASRGGTP